MTTMPTELGDLSISGSCMTTDGFNPVALYEFTPNAEGVYSIVASLIAWQPGGATIQFFVQAVWRLNGTNLIADGPPLVSGIGALSPAEISIDVNSGKGRLLVTGVPGTTVLWRLKGHQFELTTGRRGISEGAISPEMGDFAIAGSCLTVNATANVPIFQFNADRDGAYTIQAIVAAWQPDGSGAQFYLEANWRKVGDALLVDGLPFTDFVGTLGSGGITTDVSGGVGRVLVTGATNRQIFWRLKGTRLDITA